MLTKDFLDESFDIKIVSCGVRAQAECPRVDLKFGQIDFCIFVAACRGRRWPFTLTISNVRERGAGGRARKATLLWPSGKAFFLQAHNPGSILGGECLRESYE